MAAQILQVRVISVVAAVLLAAGGGVGVGVVSSTKLSFVEDIRLPKILSFIRN